MNMTMTNTLKNTQIITGIRPVINFEYERPARTKTFRSRNWLRYILGPAGVSLISHKPAEIECYSTATRQNILLQLGTGRLF